jgi:hypothetical protein
MKSLFAPTFLMSILACAALLTGCGGQEAPPTEDTPAVQAPTLEDAVAQRGDPCVCVEENIEAMDGLLESLKDVEGVTSQELNIQISQMMLPCIQPTDNPTLDRMYTREMGNCPSFSALTDRMTKVKDEVQQRMQKEAATEQASGLDGAIGANEILDKLKGA